MQRQRRRHEQRIALQRLEDHLPELSRDRVAFGDLPVVLGARRLMPGGDLAVDPFGRVEQAARMRHLLGGQNIGNLNQHQNPRPIWY